jgi:hypothetical protein
VPTLIDRFFKQLPILFPLVALFHLVMLGYSLWTFASQGVLDTFIGGGSTLVVLLYTILWLAVCDARRWGAIGYMALTAITLLLQFATPHQSEWRYVGDALSPFDVLMCFFLLFYYKRFH